MALVALVINQWLTELDYKLKYLAHWLFACKAVKLLFAKESLFFSERVLQVMIVTPVGVAPTRTAHAWTPVVGQEWATLKIYFILECGSSGIFSNNILSYIAFGQKWSEG